MTIYAVAIRQDGSRHMLALPATHAELVRRMESYGLDTSGELGFMDDREGFVDRKRAAALARAAGQRVEYLR